ncbi:MAG TPA: sigma-70 family RNA polymerase sigma factor, partial [Myxococcota bacterium]|nr:sigma-70 family RNA polymerase sigma factor [Myxococcota bacterium]
MSELAWLETTLSAARPQVIGALLRYFRDLDVAEDAFQEASLRALERWPRTGAPRDAVGWLVLVARNAGIDRARRAQRLAPLPAEDALAVEGDVEGELVERLEAASFPDDVLRLLFLCCHPELPSAHQIALALRVVSGLSVREIARAFLVSEAAMEQRITRAKRTIAEHPVPFDAPAQESRAERLGQVATVLYLLFNEGYSASGGEAHVRSALCDEALRLARLLAAMFPHEGEALALGALFALQHARTPARLTPSGEIALLDEQDRALWDRELIDEGLALLAKARWLAGEAAGLGPYALQAGIAAAHVRARTSEQTNWREIERLYAELERIQPSPVITLNRAVAVSKLHGAQRALALIEPLEAKLERYFNYYGVKATLLRDLGRAAEARSAYTR